MPKHRPGRTKKVADMQPSQEDFLLTGNENLPTVSGNMHLLCICICVIFAVWVWQLNPFEWLKDDQLNIVTLELAQEYQENFARDPVFGGNAGDFYPYLYRVSIKKFTDWFGLIGGHRFAQFPLMVGYLVVMYFVLYALTRSAPAALLVTLFSIFWRLSFGGSYWGMDRVHTVQPRSIVLIFTPLLLLMSWKYRRSWWLLVIFGIMGLLINISPPGALFFAIAVWFAMLSQGRLTRERTLLLGGAVVALIIGAAPFIYCHIAARTEATAALSTQERQLFMEALQFRFSRMSSFPIPLRTVCTVLSDFSLPLLLGVAGWAVRGQKRGPFDRWLLTYFLVAAILFVVLQYVMQKASFAMGKAPPIVSIMRGQKNAYLILYVYGAVFLRFLFSHIGKRERRILIVAMTILVFVMPLITFVHKVGNAVRQWENNSAQFRQLMGGRKIEVVGQYGAIVPVAQWVRKNTPTDSLILFGHKDMPIFRIYALRSIVSSHGCGGLAFYNGPEKLIQWYNAQKVLEHLNTKSDVERLVKLAEETGSNYIILPRNIVSVPGWSPMAYDRYWIVYVPSSASPGKPVYIRSDEFSFPG